MPASASSSEAGVLGPLLALVLTPALPASEGIERQLVVMGTTLSLRVEAPDRATALGASEAAVRAVEAVDRRLSTHREDAELARLAASMPGRWESLSDALAADLDLALACREWSEGGFDLTLGRGGPLELREGRARLLQPGPLDAGGIGKGVALDEAIAAARSAGATAASIDLGGQIASFGLDLVVDLAHARQRERVVASISLRDASVATSGQGVQPGHLLDPRSGAVVEPWGSVSVVARQAAVADCLATGLFALGPGRAEQIAETLPVREVILQIDGPEGPRVQHIAGGGA
jgi:thiamine biosynthesis lipoprotein